MLGCWLENLAGHRAGQGPRQQDIKRIERTYQRVLRWWGQFLYGTPTFSLFSLSLLSPFFLSPHPETPSSFRLSSRGEEFLTLNLASKRTYPTKDSKWRCHTCFFRSSTWKTLSLTYVDQMMMGKKRWSMEIEEKIGPGLRIMHVEDYIRNLVLCTFDPPIFMEGGFSFYILLDDRFPF